MTAYIDTSAAAKLLVDEAESEALVAHVDDVSDVGDRLVATALRAGAAQFLAYDARQQEAARAVGLRVLAPA